ncbi:MAG: LysM peptidoglycan-binding domain-containing protein [Deltaproteobacteria bacterium]|nr:LysM peptidoglycan-binding domain-containing protein [Deltaproteobacteria bacterium]
MKTQKRYLFFLVIALSLPFAPLGCNGKSEKKSGPTGVSPKETKATEKHDDRGPFGVTHTVQEGQTLWDIARAYNVSIKQIMEANQIDAREIRRLKKGARIRIPGATRVVHVETAADRAAKRQDLPPLKDGAYHFLREGESLWTLAHLYDVSIDAILERNGLSDEDVSRMRIGQAVIIPGISEERVRQDDSKKRIGIYRRVEKGETVWDIARTFEVSVAEIMAANALSAEEIELIRDGTELFLPGVEDDGRGHVRRKASASDRRAAVAAKRLGLGTRNVAGKLLRGQVEPRWMRAAGGENRFEGTLRWPVTKGWFTRGYGSGEDGYHLAVDIMGEIGWNVRAAASGIVAYSGNELRGYGNAVLVIHKGGWVTMYAHNSVNFVKAGEKVAKGGILAELGSTGISRGPHVHFEFIYDGKNCDPAALFRPGVRHRSGKLSPIDPLVWLKPKNKPREIRCAPRRRHPRSRWVIDEDPIDSSSPEVTEP